MNSTRLASRSANEPVAFLGHQCHQAPQIKTAQVGLQGATPVFVHCGAVHMVASISRSADSTR
ncbi:hypothetical protein L810_1303 [Burkholderia sp. AU4i]|nr:hypothetical protein L810_1303 [Burkholderia sp. AU4i]